MSAAVLSFSTPLDAERFQQLVESIIDYGIFMLDPQGRIRSWNSGAERLKGYKQEEVLGRHFSIFYPPEAVARGWPEEELRRAERDGRFEDEGWRVKKDGSRFWANVVITALRNPDGSLAGFAKVTRDLSERRRHEELLRASEERFRLLLEGVRDSAIFMLDPDGLIQSWNSGAAVINGYEADEVIGKHVSLFYTQSDIQSGKPANDLEQALRLGRVEEEGWRVRKDGSRFWANVTLSVLRDEAKTLRGFAAVVRDLTERRRLTELETSSKRLKEFLAMLAHELRNPLAPIRNAVTIMQLEPGPSPALRNTRDVIDRQLTHLTRLVDDLLDVGRLTTGKIKLRKETSPLGPIVTRAIEAVRPLMEARHHALTVELPPREIMLEVDATRIAQVIQNLMVNAIKYTPEQGRITLRARIEGSTLVVSVKDNGIGLTPEAMSHIFELFAQDEGSNRESGLGIGLTLARSLVEMHGGNISAASEGRNKGSTFSFTLPGARIAPLGDKAQPPEPRCLVVDDNRDAADSMAEIARLLGWSVRTAYDGKSALEIAVEFNPDAVLLDLGMPSMSGYEVIQKLRQLPGGASIWVAALTGYGNEEDRKRTTAEGFNSHLTKPVEFTALERFLNKARETSQTA
jgi:hypothetical protein